MAEEEGIGRTDITDAVGNLVDKSLIESRIDPPEASYRLLDTTRSYAFEKHVASNEDESVAARHANFSIQLLESNYFRHGFQSIVCVVLMADKDLASSLPVLPGNFPLTGGSDLSSRWQSTPTLKSSLLPNPTADTKYMFPRGPSHSLPDSWNASKHMIQCHLRACRRRRNIRELQPHLPLYYESRTLLLFGGAGRLCHRRR